jgi:hypothetical protein
MSKSTWPARDQITGRHHRNTHLLELDECDWVCLICQREFDAAVDADSIECGTVPQELGALVNEG